MTTSPPSAPLSPRIRAWGAVMDAGGQIRCEIRDIPRGVSLDEVDSPEFRVWLMSSITDGENVLDNPDSIVDCKEWACRPGDPCPHHQVVAIRWWKTGWAALRKRIEKARAKAQPPPLFGAPR